MIMNYKTTDFDIKKSYTFLNYPQQYPMIYIDEYWDYYIDQLGAKENYELFKEQYKSEGFINYNDFKNKAKEIAQKSAEKLFNTDKETVSKKLTEVGKEITKWDELPDIKSVTMSNYKSVKLDLVSGYDQTLKYLNLFNNNYNSTYEIINETTDLEIFKNKKALRILTYSFAGVEFDEVLTSYNSNVIVKNIFHFCDDTIQTLNSYGTPYAYYHGDCMIWIINEFPDKSLLGSHSINGFDYHISFNEMKTFLILGNKFQFKHNISNELDYRLSRVNCYFFPLCASLCNGQTPTEKDLAIGYEDKIFFHLNENDYEKL